VFYESLNVYESNLEWTLPELHHLLGDFQFLGATLVEQVVISSNVNELTPLFLQYAKNILRLDAKVIKPAQSMLAMPDDAPGDIVAVIHSHPGEVVYIGMQEHLTIAYVNDGYFQGYLTGPAIDLAPQSSMPPRLHLAKSNDAAATQGTILSVLGMMESALRMIRPHHDVRVVVYGPLAAWMSAYIQEPHTLDELAIFKGMRHWLKHLDTQEPPQDGRE
jgi:hypothetical protein